MNSRFRSLLRLGSRAAGLVAPIAQLLTRVVLGHAYVLTGLGKLQHLERTTQFFASLGIPAPAANALFIGALELVGGAALVLGLCTRLFAALLATSLVVALLTADRESFVAALSGAGDQALTDVASFAFLLYLLWLVGFGAGLFSVDRWLARKLRLGSLRPDGHGVELAQR